MSTPTIGIFGNGFVGSAISNGFKHYTDVKVFDIDPRKTVNDYKSTIEQDVLFLCLPTPMAKNGEVDLDIVYLAMETLSLSLGNLEVPKVIIIKSTVPPGTCQHLQNMYHNLFVIFNPEFLTERTAELDFIQQKRIILGVGNKASSRVNLAKDLFECRFPGVPIKIMHWDEASLIKYYSNVFFCTKLSLINEFAQVTEALGFKANNIMNEVLNDGRIGRSHHLVPGHDGHKGWGGSCFIKDLNGYMKFAEQLGVDPKMAKAAWEKNLEIRPERDWEDLKGRAVSDE